MLETSAKARRGAGRFVWLTLFAAALLACDSRNDTPLMFKPSPELDAAPPGIPRVVFSPLYSLAPGESIESLRFGVGGTYVYTSNSKPKSARIVRMSLVNEDFAAVPPGDLPSHGRWLMVRDNVQTLQDSAYFFVVDGAKTTHIKKLSQGGTATDMYSTASNIRGEITDSNAIAIYAIETEPGKQDTVVRYMPNGSSLDRSTLLSNSDGHTITDLVINDKMVNGRDVGGVLAFETYTIHDPHWNTDEEHFVVESVSYTGEVTSKDVVVPHGAPAAPRFSRDTTTYGFSVGDGLWSMALDTLTVQHLPSPSFGVLDVVDQNLANHANLAFGGSQQLGFALMGLEYAVVGSQGAMGHTFAAARLDGTGAVTYDVTLPDDCQLTPISDDHRLSDQLVTAPTGDGIYLACGAQLTEASWVAPSN